MNIKKNKKKKKSAPQKNRTNWVYGRVADEVTSINVNYDPLSDSFSIDGLDVSSINHVVSHERDSGKDKVISSLPVGVNSFSMLSFEEQLAKSFDYLVAVDTNTLREPVAGFYVSACVAYFLEGELKRLKGSCDIVYLCSFLILNSEAPTKPESLGWHLTMSKYMSVDRVGNKKIGVIVDSELGDIPDINAGSLSYYQGFKLPSKVSLIYSSADKSEHLGNQMIKLCDAAASDVLRKFSLELAPSLDLTRAEKHGSSFVFDIIPKNC